MITLIASILIASTRSNAAACSYDSFRSGHAIYHVVTADLGCGLVHATTIRSNLKSPGRLIYGKHPLAAITGTFFNPYGGKPVGDVLVNGHLTDSGNRGSALAISWTGEASIFDKPFCRSIDWSPYRYGLRGAVRLIENGKVQPNPRAQHFHDPRIWGRAARTAVGVTKAGKLVLCATNANVTLSELGRAMLTRGVRNAVSLDGGGSTYLYYRGSTVVKTGRALSNMLLLERDGP